MSKGSCPACSASCIPRPPQRGSPYHCQTVCSLFPQWNIKCHFLTAVSTMAAFQDLRLEVEKAGEYIEATNLRATIYGLTMAHLQWYAGYEPGRCERATIPGSRGCCTLELGLFRCGSQRRMGSKPSERDQTPGRQAEDLPRLRAVPIHS